MATNNTNSCFPTSAARSVIPYSSYFKHYSDKALDPFSEDCTHLLLVFQANNGREC